MKFFVILFATWGGTGFSPVASGTVGTVAAIPFYLVMSGIVQNKEATGVLLVAMAAVLLPYGVWLPIALVVSTIPALFVVLLVGVVLVGVGQRLQLVARRPLSRMRTRLWTLSSG